MNSFYNRFCSAFLWCGSPVGFLKNVFHNIASSNKVASDHNIASDQRNTVSMAADLGVCICRQMWRNEHED